MNTPEEEKLIGTVRQVLDSSQPDADSRRALQIARGQALSAHKHVRQRMPWLPFAVSACLLVVLALNIPTAKMVKPSTKPANTVAKAEPTQAAKSTKSAKPAETAPVNPASKAPIDAELLENLELYEDAEFYQWLSEQPKQGAHDA